MKVEELSISGLKLITPDVFGDNRGFFMESYNQEKFGAIGIHTVFVQDNHSRSVKNTLRGLHFQRHPGQTKLVRCVRGSVWDVAVDIRLNSPTFGKWQAVELSEENKQMFFIPAGFAHGFCVLSEEADFLYKVSSVYNGETEAGIAWDDPKIAVEWPIKEPVLSQRDLSNQSLDEFKRAVEANRDLVNW